MAMPGYQSSSFQSNQGSFMSGYLWRTYTPATGQTLRMKWDGRKIYLAHASTIATQTVLLPLGVGDDDVVEIYTKSAVTTATFQDGLGGAIAGAPTTMAAGSNTFFAYKSGVGWLPGVSALSRAA